MALALGLMRERLGETEGGDTMRRVGGGIQTSRESRTAVERVTFARIQARTVFRQL